MSVSYRFISPERRWFHCLSRFFNVFFSCRWCLGFSVVVIQKLGRSRGSCANENSSVRQSFWVSPTTMDPFDFFFFFVFCFFFFHLI